MSLFDLPPAWVAYVIVIAMILGACCASALTCMAARISQGESWMSGRSHCDACGHELKAKDLIPIISWISLKGKCRYCGTKISKMAPLGEAFLAIVFALLVIRFGFTIELAKAAILVLVLFPASVCDLYTFEIPDRFWVIGSIIWLVLLPFATDWKTELISGLEGGVLITLAVLVISLIVGKVLQKDAMGGGDFKLYFLTGLYLGFSKNLMNVMVSCVIGLILSKVMIQKVTEDEEVPEGAFPFGPAIALSALVCMLIGDPVVAWYLSLLQ